MLLVQLVVIGLLDSLQGVSVVVELKEDVTLGEDEFGGEGRCVDIKPSMR